MNLQDLPGHLIRRLQQIAVAVFLQETEAHGITPIQYAALNAISQSPGTDQRSLAARIGLDTSTTASVIDRLQAREWVQRRPCPQDKRLRRLDLTPEGERLLRRMSPAVQQAQARMLSPLTAAEQAELMRMLQTLVTSNNELSRAPLREHSGA